MWPGPEPCRRLIEASAGEDWTSRYAVSITQCPPSRTMSRTTRRFSLMAAARTESRMRFFSRPRYRI
jgi:hypothetical protein